MKKDNNQFKLQNITISIPENYDINLKKLQNNGLIASRSEGIRIAVKEFIEKEYYNAKLLGYKINL